MIFRQSRSPSTEATASSRHHSRSPSSSSFVDVVATAASKWQRKRRTDVDESGVAARQGTEALDTNSRLLPPTPSRELMTARPQRAAQDSEILSRSFTTQQIAETRAQEFHCLAPSYPYLFVAEQPARKYTRKMSRQSSMPTGSSLTLAIFRKRVLRRSRLTSGQLDGQQAQTDTKPSEEGTGPSSTTWLQTDGSSSAVAPSTKSLLQARQSRRPKRRRTEEQVRNRGGSTLTTPSSSTLRSVSVNTGADRHRATSEAETGDDMTEADR